MVMGQASSPLDEIFTNIRGMAVNTKSYKLMLNYTCHSDKLLVKMPKDLKKKKAFNLKLKKIFLRFFFDVSHLKSL